MHSLDVFLNTVQCLYQPQNEALIFTQTISSKLSYWPRVRDTFNLEHVLKDIFLTEYYTFNSQYKNNITNDEIIIINS